MCINVLITDNNLVHMCCPGNAWKAANEKNGFFMYCFGNVFVVWGVILNCVVQNHASYRNQSHQ